MNNWKAKADDLVVFKLKTVPIDLKKLSDVVDNEVIKNTNFNKLKTKVKKIREENPWRDYFNLHKLTQYRLLNLEKKKMELLIKITQR